MTSYSRNALVPSLIGRFEQTTAVQRTMILASVIVNIGLLAALFVTIYLLRHREILYVTTSGIQPAGYVSTTTAQEYAVQFIHWFHTFTYSNIQERNQYLAPQLCSGIANSYTAILETEARQVQKNRIFQTINLQSVNPLPSDDPLVFRFQYKINRNSTLLGQESTFAETYEITVQHAPAPDGTRRLCIAGHKRI